MNDGHVAFTEAEARAAGLKLNETAAHVVPEPATPGEKITAELVKNNIKHYSVRPEEAVDVPAGLTYDELQARTDLHLDKAQMEALANRAKTVTTTQVKPNNLKC